MRRGPPSVLDASPIVVAACTSAFRGVVPAEMRPSRTYRIGALEHDEARDGAVTSQDDKPTREDAAYTAVFGLLRRNVFVIAWLAPFPVVLLMPRDGPWAVVLMAMYLGEAAVYRVSPVRGRSSLAVTLGYSSSSVPSGSWL